MSWICAYFVVTCTRIEFPTDKIAIRFFFFHFSIVSKLFGHFLLNLHYQKYWRKKLFTATLSATLLLTAFFSLMQNSCQLCLHFTYTFTNVYIIFTHSRTHSQMAHAHIHKRHLTSAKHFTRHIAPNVTIMDAVSKDMPFSKQPKVTSMWLVPSVWRTIVYNINAYSCVYVCMDVCMDVSWHACILRHKGT